MKNINEYGRSMIEMLGVLTIMGLLTFIGIFGYNKAMDKVALNKQAQQVNDFSAAMIAFLGQTASSTFTTTTLGSTFTQLGYLPDSITTSTTATHVFYDYYGNTIQIYGVSTSLVEIWWYFASTEQYVNLQQTLQRFAGNIQHVSVAGNNPTHYGTRECKTGRLCLASLTLSDFQSEGVNYSTGSRLQIFFYRR